MTVDFAGGDPRFIYAIRRDGAPGLIELPDGEGAAYRDMARSALMCPVRGCPSPEITTVAGSDRRHHFRHLVRSAGTDHGPETWFHLESKAVMQQWLRERYPDATVELERRLGDGARIADVFATLASGEQYAIEVQFSSLTVEAYQERHDWYAAHGIVDVWIFIHSGVHLRREWGDTTTVLLSPTHRAVVESGRRALWMNPMLRMIGYGRRAVNVGPKQWLTHPLTEGRLVTEALDAFQLDRHIGLTSARLSRMDEDTAAAREAQEEQRQREEAERLEWARERQRRAVEIDERNAAGRAEKARRRQARLEFIEAWSTSDEAMEARAAFPDGPPRWIEDDGGLDVDVPARAWRWHLYATHVRSHEPGRYITEQLLQRELVESYPGVFTKSDLKQAVRQLLSAMLREGLVHGARERAGWWVVGPARDIAVVQPTAITPPEPASGEHLCPVCGLGMDPNIPQMRAHFYLCEARLGRMHMSQGR